MPNNPDFIRKKSLHNNKYQLYFNNNANNPFVELNL